MNILGLNTAFDSLEYAGFDEHRFSAEISLLDYEAVVIDVGYLVENSYEDELGTHRNKNLLSHYESSQICEDFAKIREQIVELLKQGRTLFVLMGNNESCYIYTGEKQFSGIGKNSKPINIVKEFDTYSFLPVSIHATHVHGNNIKFCGTPLYRDFFNQIGDCSQYESYFTVEEQNFSFAKIKETDKVIATSIPYENGTMVLLPVPYYEDDYEDTECWQKYGAKYLDGLFKLAERIAMQGEEFHIPRWLDIYSIFNEKEEIDRKIVIEKEIEILTARLEDQKTRIKGIQNYKLLLVASGEVLEEIVKHVLVELDFEILASEKGRSDIIAKYGDIGIVAEIKGISKSAAEKHAAQLEKWVSEYIDQYEGVPKALLIVNGFCDKPLSDRTEDVFPNQMLSYCESRKHILITTTQLLCLCIEVRNDPTCKEERIKELLSCIGKYERYRNYNDFIEIDEGVAHDV